MKKIAWLADYREEGWFSMDRVADALSQEKASWNPDWQTAVWRPSYQRYPLFHVGGRWGRNLERFANRYFHFPRWLRAQKTQADVFHILDHSYAHLAHELPPQKTIVTCHDTDAFRSLRLEEAEVRPWWFRKMSRRVLTGLQRATLIICDSAATQEALRTEHGFPSDRLRVIPLGVEPVFFAEAATWEKPRSDIGLLHVGSTIPRKRIELLLEIFAGIRRHYPQATLTRVGGDFTQAQRERAQALGVLEAIVVQPTLSNEVLAQFYARATLTLLPSAREGFGFPILESLAGGTRVLASDLPVLRELDGPGVGYVAGDDPEVWIGALLKTLGEPRPTREERMGFQAWARQFTWLECAKKLQLVYDEIA
jgi:glycosyltransferase involved in cell wall biosynthesis